ncbi:MAG: hypothetical protein AAF694_19070 [Bacteroidota bacterium]
MFEGKALRNVIIAGAILLLGLVSFLAYSNQKVEQGREAAEQKVDEITSLLDQTEEEMLELEVLFEAREEQVEVRNQLLKQRKIELANLKKQIEQLKRGKVVDAKTIARLEDKVAQMEAQLNQIQENEMDYLLAQVKVQQNVIDSISVDATNLRKENQDMRKQLGLSIEVATETVGNSSKLPDAENFAFYNTSTGGRVQVVDVAAANLTSMDICFEIQESFIEIGDYDLFLVYTDGNGIVHFSPESKNTFLVNGGKSFFTAKKNVRLDGAEKTVCMPITFDDPPGKGIQEVRVYLKEEIIGRGTYQVR